MLWNSSDLYTYKYASPKESGTKYIQSLTGKWFINFRCLIHYKTNILGIV
jgi:hypothetical protein